MSDGCGFFYGWSFMFGEKLIFLKTIKLTGTGRTSSLFPARSAMWRYRGTPFSAAPALHMASDTPRIELAPNLAGGEIEAVTNITHTCSRYSLVRKHVSTHIYHHPTRDVSEAYICCQCRPFQSSHCPASPAPAHWFPGRKTQYSSYSKQIFSFQSHSAAHQVLQHKLNILLFIPSLCWMNPHHVLF